MSAGEIANNIADAAINTSAAEYIAVTAALTYIVLAARQKVLCWLFWIISSALYIIVCINAQLYPETILQVFFVITGFYGWWQWVKNKASSDHAPIVKWTYSKHLLLVAGGAAGGGALGYFFDNYTEAAQPYLDSLITSFSFIATWLLSKKILENWMYWIAINAAAIILYSSRELYLSGLLYLLYTILSVTGLLAWKKEIRTSNA